MTDLTFLYDDHPVRVVTIDGEPWFVLSDLCKILDLPQVSRVKARLDDALTSSTPIADSMGRTQQATVVSEPGMYEVVIRSDKPEAVAFRRWITHEVIPSIRKTGSYQVAPVYQLPASYSEALRALAQEVEAREAMECYAKELEPKADAYDTFLSGDGTYAIAAVAKMLGRSQNKLFDELRNAGVLIAKGAQRNVPYQQYMHHFAVKGYDFTRADGTVGTSYTTRVQPSGVEFIRRKLGIPALEGHAA